MTVHVLILCTHNSARSVLAEGMLGHLARQLGRDVVAHSAGSAPSGRVNPLALAVLAEAGVDVSGFHSKSWDAFTGAGAPPIDIVITVCDSAAAESCPVFLGGQGQAPLKVHWGYPDPSREVGETAQRRAFELTRQALAWRLRQLLDALDLLDGAAQAPADRAALQQALVAIGRS